MRIITGKARGVALKTLEGETTRPTSARAKEAIFSIIQFDIEGRTVLDLFGGSGQLGLESLSRGADKAVIADSSKAAVSVIEYNADKTKLKDKCRIMFSDWQETLRRLNGEKFDIVFLDPPYKLGLIPQILSRLKNNVKPTSVIICETGEDITEDINEQYDIIKQAKYGIANITIIKQKPEE